MKIRRTKVTVVKEHVFTYAEHGAPLLVACEQCGVQTRMVLLDDRGLTSGADLQELRRDVQASGLHYTEGPDGSLLVCFGPIQRALANRRGLRRFF